MNTDLPPFWHHSLSRRRFLTSSCARICGFGRAKHANSKLCAPSPPTNLFQISLPMEGAQSSLFVFQFVPNCSKMFQMFVGPRVVHKLRHKGTCVFHKPNFTLFAITGGRVFHKRGSATGACSSPRTFS